MSEDDVKALATIASTASAAGAGSVTVATITSTAPGILGVIPNPQDRATDGV